ncbi:MAG: CPBP family intramembrane metalloprotease [Thaumarchaeota archaeon]|nr:CPBP family intramembrane metalloprotease [Nitrososphaerota archaeon]
MVNQSKGRTAEELSETADGSDQLGPFWLFLFACIILVAVSMMFVSFPAGIYTVFATHLSNNYTASTQVHSLTYDLLFVQLNVPISATIGEVFLSFLAIYLLFIVLAASQGGGIVRALRASVSDGYLYLFSNPLTAMTVLLGATSLATAILDTLQVNSGIATGGLTGDPFALLVDITIAPLLEESLFRLIMIGVPVFLFVLLLRQSSLPRAIRVLWRPSAAWDVEEDDGVETRHKFEDATMSLFPASSSSSPLSRALRPVVYVFMTVSSVIFGYVHFAGGAGWGPGKISEAALAGLVFGYLYVKYGFHTSVLLHWSINYVGSIYSFLAQGVWGISWTSNTGSPLDYVPSVVIILLLGVPGLLLVANELLKKATRPSV